MPTADTQRIAKHLIEKRLATEAQVRRGIDLLEKRGDAAGARALLDLLVRQRIITETQAQAVHSQTAAAARSPTRMPQIEGYQILGRIGAGGMGIVLKGKHLALDREVALKILSPALAKEEIFVRRFVREARSAARLNHPNIVQPLDVGKASNVYYLAMEYVEGPSLSDQLREGGRRPSEEVLNVGLQMAEALVHAESCGLIHRDIKPANILLTPKGMPKLADFGLARQATDASLTTTEEATLGTPCYMSPEQVRGVRDLDIRTDIYSLGATLYHLATGSVPFEGDTAALVMVQRLTVQPEPPHERVPGVPRGLSDVIMKTMAKERADRYQTAAELAADLRTLVAGGTPQASRRSVRRALQASALGGLAGRRKWVAAVLVGVLGLIAAIAYSSRHQQVAEGTGDSTQPASTSSVDRPRPRASGTAAPIVEREEPETATKSQGAGAESQAPSSGADLWLTRVLGRAPVWQSLFDGKSIRNWTIDSGMWAVQNGEIVGEGLDHGMLYVGDENWQDYVFRARFRLVSPGACGIIVWMKEADPEIAHTAQPGPFAIATGYRLGFLPGGHGFSYCVDGWPPGKGRRHYRNAYDAQSGAWHEVVCCARRADVRLCVDGREVPISLDARPDRVTYLTHGRVALFLERQTTARFKDVKVALLQAAE